MRPVFSSDYSATYRWNLPVPGRKPLNESLDGGVVSFYLGNMTPWRMHWYGSTKLKGPLRKPIFLNHTFHTHNQGKPGMQRTVWCCRSRMSISQGTVSQLIKITDLLWIITKPNRGKPARQRNCQSGKFESRSPICCVSSQSRPKASQQGNWTAGCMQFQNVDQSGNREAKISKLLYIITRPSKGKPVRQLNCLMHAVPEHRPVRKQRSQDLQVAVYHHKAKQRQASKETDLFDAWSSRTSTSRGKIKPRSPSCCVSSQSRARASQQGSPTVWCMHF